MKLLYLSIAAIIFASSCSNQTATETQDAQTVLSDSLGDSYKVDATQSVINWEGNSLSGGHNGTINIKEGSINVKEGNIVSGSFIIDMLSINDLDLTDSVKRGYLVGHLNDTDFFDTKKYPTGQFDITNIEVIQNDSNGNTHNISGNLTLKGQTKNITIPAKVSIENDVFNATGSVVINRLDWGITYSSITAFPNLKAKLKDKAIKDFISIKIALVAKK